MNWVNIGLTGGWINIVTFTLVMPKINILENQYFEFALKKEVAWGFYAPPFPLPPSVSGSMCSYLLCFKQ